MAKKICFVSTTSATMKSFIFAIAESLFSEGIDVTLVCSDDKAFQEQCESRGIHFIPVHMGRGIDVSGLKSTVELYRLFKNQHFDVVQYCTPNAACYASIAAKKARVPVRLYCQWGIRYVGMSGISRRIFKRIERMVCRLSTDVRAVSKKNKVFAVSEKLYPEEKAKVIGNGGTIGVDLQRFDISKKGDFRKTLREKLQINENDVVFGFCGRLSRDKGSNELLSAFRSISERLDNTRLLIVGSIENTTDIDADLLSWAKRSDRIILTGKIPEDEVFQYYTPMDVLVHPTYREGFGMVIQEAGAYGIPIITTDVPGASEVMIDGESCLLVKAKKTDSLIETMERLIKDGILRERIGEKAYLRTKHLYERSIMLGFQVNDFLDLLG